MNCVSEVTGNSLNKIIELKHGVKVYQDINNKAVYALADVFFEACHGEMVSVMGASGSGKTTLLQILGGIETLTSGDYYYNGQNVSRLSVSARREFRKNNIGFVFQNYALMDHYTVYENVALPLIIRKVPADEQQKKVEEALKIVGLFEKSHRIPSNLSGGEMQRCGIARAIVTDAPLLLADEPTGSLDWDNSKSIMELFCELKKLGHTIIIATHDPKISDYCDRVVRIGN